jgi:hypothetical protein
VLGYCGHCFRSVRRFQFRGRKRRHVLTQ